jgi:hypothetical protein
MASTESSTTSDPATHASRRRMLGVLFAVLAPVVIWIIAVPLAGVDLMASQAGDGTPVQEINLVSVIVAALLVGLLGWALLAVLERFTRRGASIWTIVAVLVLLLSLAGPLVLAQNGGAKLTLALMHVAVGVTLITTLARSARA